MSYSNYDIPLDEKQDENTSNGFKLDKGKVGLFTLIGAAIGFGFEYIREIMYEKAENKKLLTSYQPEGFDVDERSFVLMKRLEHFGKTYPRKYVELVWILDALLFREKQLYYHRIMPMFDDVPKAQRLVETFDRKLKSLTVSNKKWKSLDMANATVLYQELMDFAKHHLSNIYSLCQNVARANIS